jgi:ribosomal subunit interface protein
MHLEVSFRNLGPREEVRKRAQFLFEKLARFLDPAAQGQLTIAVEHGLCIVEVALRAHGYTFKVREEDNELRTALDKSFHTLEQQLRRAKDRRTTHKGRGTTRDVEVDEPGPPSQY